MESGLQQDCFLGSLQKLNSFWITIWALNFKTKLALTFDTILLHNFLLEKLDVASIIFFYLFLSCLDFVPLILTFLILIYFTGTSYLWLLNQTILTLKGVWYSPVLFNLTVLWFKAYQASKRVFIFFGKPFVSGATSKFKFCTHKCF